MTIENSEDTAQVGVSDPAESPVAQPAPGSTEPNAAFPATEASSAVIEAPRLGATHDSGPPMSRKLAPPPKPKRDSNMASSPPSARPPGESGPDLLASSSALKAPLAPTISFSTEPVGVPPELTDVPEPPAIAASGTSNAPGPLSQPPPIPRRRSNPSFSAEANDVAGRPPSDPTLGSALGSVELDEARAAAEKALKAASTPPRPLSAAVPRPRSEPPPPRPRSEPPPPALVSSGSDAAPISAAPSSTPPSSSAIFAMRIIAVGDSVRPPVVSETPDLDPDSYPPSASRLGTSVRRSSRPAMAAVSAPVEPPAPVPAPSPLPVDLLPPIEEDVPIDVEPPITSALAAAVPVPALEEFAASVVPAPVSAAPAAPTVQLRPPPPPPPVELGAGPPSPAEVGELLAEADIAPDSAEKKGAPDADAEELGREDAISLPPEELAALKAQLDAKAEVKPPPPPKRVTGALGAMPSGPTASEGPAKEPKEPPPTPDPAAAKAAQRAKTRQPWWEDLFNEDFMRASSRVTDEQVRREVTFIEESLGVAAGGVVLDLGCGSGHHAVEFASRGYGVVGYDLSLYQLALAADVAQERSQKINFLQGDMREMAFEEMFDGVFCWNTTFGYFEEDKNLAVAQRVFKALRPGGMFLIDVLNRDFAAASAPCTVWYEGDSCVCMDDMSVDYISSRLRVKRSIILDDGRTKESLFSLRLYSLHELGKLLHEVGFRVTEASGHPATPGVFFGPNSPRIIMLAQRP